MGNSDKRSGLSRRSFIKLAAAGGLGAFGVSAGLVYPSGWEKWLSFGRKPWELDLGVVDYDVVKKVSWGPPELGFNNDIRKSPPSERVLNVAQWYDYWPGKTISDFTGYMEKRWNLPGVSVNWTSNIYTANEELFTWVTQTGRKFDVMVPTNYTVETMEKAGLLANLNKEWVPNHINIFGKIPSPAELDRSIEFYPSKYGGEYPKYPNGYNNAAMVDFRTPESIQYRYRGSRNTYPNPRGTDNFTWAGDSGMLTLPYQWGTTGIGYRSDIFRREDIEEMGWDVFELTSYKNPKTGDTYNLTKKKMMLDDMREVFTAALKDVGWKNQVSAGYSPTTRVRAPGDPETGHYQWSNNEVEESKLLTARDWLLSFKNSSWGFNTPQQGPWLVSRTMYVDQAWSGDVMYAVRPNSSQHLPVDYFVPEQGGARWIDNLTIHRECEKLWLSHEFINYIHDPRVQATISAWNLYATPNAWSFEVLDNDPSFTFQGQNLDGTPYTYNQAHDSRIYSDTAIGFPKDQAILNRCEYQKDVGVRNNLRYFDYWRQVKF